MAKSNQRGRSNNNSEGRNQFSNDWTEVAKDRPFTSAAAAAGAVAAGVFLWSKRSQISDQISRLSDQITDWADDMRSGTSGNSDRELEFAEGANQSSATQASRSTKRRSASGPGTSAKRATSSTVGGTRGQSGNGQTIGAGAGFNS